MYAILRAEKIKTLGNAGGLNAHLERKMEVPNADTDLSHLNRRHIGTGDLAKDISDRLEQAGITPRKNAVLAVEYLMTVSPEMVASLTKKAKEGGGYTLNGNSDEVNKWKVFEKKCMSWLKERHKGENVVNFTVHLDEKTPHIHAVVVPIDGKGKLNCREFLGGRAKLSEMQDSFAKVHEEIGLKRGIAGSKAEHEEVKKFYSKLPEINTSPSELFKQAEQGKQALKEKSVLESNYDALKKESDINKFIINSVASGKLSVEQLKSFLEKKKQESTLNESKNKPKLKL